MVAVLSAYSTLADEVTEHLLTQKLEIEMRDLPLHEHIMLFRTCQFLDATALTWEAAAMIARKFTAGLSPEEVYEKFAPHITHSNPNTPSKWEVVRTLVFKRPSTEAVILNNDEWLELLIHWDTNLLCSNAMPPFLKTLVTKEENSMYLETYSVGNLRIPETRERQLLMLQAKLQTLISIPRTSTTFSAYHLVYTLLSSKSRVVSKSDVLEVVKAELEHFFQRAAEEAATEAVTAGARAATAHLALAWKQARLASRQLAVVCSYILRFRCVGDPEEQVFPWKPAPLLALFHQAAASLLGGLVAQGGGGKEWSADVRRMLIDLDLAPTEGTGGNDDMDASELPQPLAGTVTLLTSDGHKVHVAAHLLSESPVLAALARGRASDDEPIRLPDKSCTAAMVKIVVSYLEEGSGGKSEESKAQIQNLEDEEFFELILAANFLDLKGLVDLGCKIVADYIKQCRTPEEIRARFQIPNDFTPEEEEEARRENAWCEEAP